eukprot:Em0004g930a
MASLSDACPVGQFDCTGTGIGNGTSCINAALVCDNRVNCPSGGLDENTAMICGCKRGNSNCVCIVGPGNEIVCGCSQGTLPVGMRCTTPVPPPKGNSKKVKSRGKAPPPRRTGKRYAGGYKNGRLF